jgi:hypothetical protein
MYVLEGLGRFRYQTLTGKGAIGAIGDSKRYFERRRTLSDRSIPGIPAPITSAQRA